MATRLLNTQRIVNLASDPGSGNAGEVYYNTVANALKVYNGTSWGEIGGGGGTVTSVGVSVPTGLSVANSPVTTSGTIAISLASGYTIPTTAALDAKAPLASPTFTGTVTLPTVSASGVFTTSNYINRTTANGNSSWLQQDGTGRVHWYWNTLGGTSPTFTNAGEDASAITQHVTLNGNGGSVFFRSANGVGASAGGPITWTTTLYVDLNTITFKGTPLALTSGATFTGTVIAPAATTSIPSIRLPHGTAPTSPTNGDIWTTTSGLFARINGSTQQYAANNQTMHIGTTAVAINRASGSLALTGISSIDGSAATLTTSRTIGDVSFNGSGNIVPERVLYKDTRAVNYNPFTYIGTTLHLKTNTTDGLSDGGTYHGVLDLAHWSDSSGGVNHQLGLTDNGNMYIRNSTGATTWSSWKRFATVDQVGSGGLDPFFLGGM